MRIASNQFRNQAVSSILTHESALGKLQEQATSGRRVNRASDDPLAVAEIERLRSAQARVDIEKRMMSYARNLMAQGESALSNSIQSLQEARDTLISAGNAIRNPSDRQSLAEKLSALRSELFAQANAQDHEGDYLFGGPGADRMPFAPEDAPQYRPGPGVRFNGLNVAFELSLNGGEIFLGFGANGRGSIFEELDEVVAVLADPAVNDERLTNRLREGMRAIDETLRRTESARTSVGEQMRILDSRERVVSSGELSTAKRRSDLVDTDYSKVLSDVKARSTALEAAMQTYSHVSNLSLFNYF